MADVLRKGASLQLVVTPPGQRRVGVYSGWGRRVVATCAADEWVPFQYAAGRHAHVITPVGYMGEITIKSQFCVKIFRDSDSEALSRLYRRMPEVNP